MTDVARIAEQLTEAQRNRIFYPEGYADPNTVKSLVRRGIMRGSSLTSLGVAVRAHLQGEG